MQQTVIVGMSGGVDSTVSALLLKEQGYRVVGVFMRNWDDSAETDSSCKAQRDWSDVASACAQIDIPYYVFDFRKEYYDHVFTPFLAEYKKGKTPNPDILCNKKIKFDFFLKKALSLGADYIATGHYARIADGKLLKGVDNNKDQSYFLYSIDRKCFDKVLFPLGDMNKTTVRKIAKDNSLDVYNKKDSTGICFIEEKKFRPFMQKYIPKSAGDFVLLSGEVVGKHEGACFYTIGQRRGLNLGGEGKRWFVVKKDIEKNVVYVERDHDHSQLYTTCLEASSLNWLCDIVTGIQITCCAKIRYRQADQDCIAYFVEEDRLKVKFSKPQRGVALSQSIVFYEGDVCLGGGVVDKIENHAI